MEIKILDAEQKAFLITAVNSLRGEYTEALENNDSEMIKKSSYTTHD